MGLFSTWVILQGCFLAQNCFFEPTIQAEGFSNFLPGHDKLSSELWPGVANHQQVLHTTVQWRLIILKDQGFQGFQWIRCDLEFYHFSSYQLRTMRLYGTCSPSLPWSWKVWMMQEHWWSIDTGAQGVMRRCRHVRVWESKALDRFVWRLFAWLSW